MTLTAEPLGTESWRIQQIEANLNLNSCVSIIPQKIFVLFMQLNLIYPVLPILPKLVDRQTRFSKFATIQQLNEISLSQQSAQTAIPAKGIIVCPI